jgi:hypothetical protein
MWFHLVGLTMTELAGDRWTTFKVDWVRRNAEWQGSYQDISTLQFCRWAAGLRATAEEDTKHAPTTMGNALYVSEAWNAINFDVFVIRVLRETLDGGRYKAVQAWHKPLIKVPEDAIGVYNRCFSL